MPHNTLQSKFNTERSKVRVNKRTLGKRFSKFLSKMFWHFNQSVPDYSSVNHRSVKKPVINPDRHRRPAMDIGHHETSYPTVYQKRSIWQHTSTLMSIEEENEIELTNCK